MTDETHAMTQGEIFAALGDYDYTLPEKALRAAASMPEIMAPLLLELLEQALADSSSKANAARAAGRLPASGRQRLGRQPNWIAPQ